MAGSAEPKGAPAPEEPLREEDRAELEASVRRNVAEVRRTNAVALAWIRVGLRAATLTLYAVTWLRLPQPELPVSMASNAVHLAVGVGVLVLLLRRSAVAAAIGVGAVSDFAAVFAGAWRTATGPLAEAASAYFMGAIELLLLFAALTLPRRAVTALGVASTAFMVAVVVRTGATGSGPPLIVVTLATFAVAVIWAGTRFVEMVARTAAEAHAGQLVRRHRDALQRSEAALRAAQAEAETLTQLIVHDLRSPAATIGMSLDALRGALDGKVPRADAEEALAIGRDEVRRLTSMVGDLLVVARLEGGLRVAAEPTEVRPLLDDVSRAMDSRVRDAGAVLEVRGPSGLSAPLDVPLARRMLENLVANALRHVGPGDRVELAVEGDGGVRMAVRNTGPPVPGAIRDHIFDKHATHGRREWHNAGLGLYLCRLVAEAHGGRIVLRDRTGWNVSFEVDLPAPG